jgi:transposase
MFTSFLLPEVEGLQLEQVEAERSCIALTMAMTAPAALCPVCRQPSYRVQSRYLRTIADVPWAGVPVRLQLHVRRFVCGNSECQRAMFCERLGPAIRAYARRTQRLEGTIEQIGFAVGGEAGARLLTNLGMAASPATILRLLRGASTPARSTPRVLGVDDWAWCKGRTYGAILCDLEQHCVVDLLPDRLAATLAAWLRSHPGVEVISRDRASGFARCRPSRCSTRHPGS